MTRTLVPQKTQQQQLQQTQPTQPQGRQQSRQQQCLPNHARSSSGSCRSSMAAALQLVPDSSSDCVKSARATLALQQPKLPHLLLLNLIMRILQ